MAALFTAFASGLLFGLGLLASGMAYPVKVLDFLDVTGAWDASLLFVMASAVGVASLAFGVAGRRRKSLLELPIRLPSRTGVTRRLVLGSLVFGVGWGLAGICPGPAFVALGAGAPKAVVFVGAMVLGMLVFEILERSAHPARHHGSLRDGTADA